MSKDRQFWNEYGKLTDKYAGKAYSLGKSSAFKMDDKGNFDIDFVHRNARRLKEAFLRMTAGLMNKYQVNLKKITYKT